MCVIVNLIYGNEFGFENQIFLKHIKYIKLCALTKMNYHYLFNNFYNFKKNVIINYQIKEELGNNKKNQNINNRKYKAQ